MESYGRNLKFDLSEIPKPKWLGNLIPADQSYINNLGMFINFSNDNVKRLYSDIERKEMKHAQYRETIWKSCGCAIVDRKRYKLDK